MGSNLYEAFNQWAERPADERYWSLDDLMANRLHMQHTSHELEVHQGGLTVAKLSDDWKEPQKREQLVLSGQHGRFELTNHSFNQLCRHTGLGADTLRKLPAHIVLQALNHRLQENDGIKRLLTYQPRVVHRDRQYLRALTGKNYARVWDAQIVDRLQALQDQGWKVPPGRPAPGQSENIRPAMPEDLIAIAGTGGPSVNLGDPIGPSGIYASDHDLFVVMVNDERPIHVPGSDQPLYRCFYIKHSEVGDAAFSGTFCLINHICGNHILWNVQGVTNIRVVHRGDPDDVAREMFGQLRHEVREYTDQGVEVEERAIARAVDFKIEDGREKTIQRLKEKGIAPAKELEAAYHLAEEHPEDGHKGPDTAYGMIQGFTRLAQRSPHQDRRAALDHKATRLFRFTEKESPRGFSVPSGTVGRPAVAAT